MKGNLPFLPTWAPLGLLVRRSTLFLLVWIMTLASHAEAQLFLNAEQQVAGQFESMAFGGQTEAAIRKKLQSQFELEIKQMILCCNLSESQQEKLRLAAQGDISRFFRTVEKARKSSQAFNVNDQEQMQKFWQIASPIQTKLQSGLATSDSLFRKVVDQTLEPEQKVALDKREEEVNRSRMAVYIKLRIAKIERQVPLVSSQRQSLIDMIEESIRGKNIPAENVANITDLVLSGYSDEKLGKVLDADQVAGIRKVVQNVDGMRQQLARKGIKLE